ncbi:cytochrome P450 4C1-like [Danaus plexippus]|uniref:cytochrome P450 4C1-like n=1 Tax=Danaus plexippus TaxID=13037 RepID=UPI002AB0D29D|nr:cytochrome P450 4C1-like [Danaus plexippus]
MLFLSLILATIILLIVLHDYISRSKRLIRKIPGPKSYPIIGNTIPYILSPENLFHYLRTLHNTYGELNQVHALSVQAVNVFSPEDMEVILSSTKHNDKQLPYTFLKPWLGEGLLTSNGLKWHQRRKLLTKAFHFNILKKYSATFTEQTQEFIKKVHEETKKSKTDVLPLICSATLHIMCETAIPATRNEGIQTITQKYFKSIHTVGEAVVERMCRVWLYFDPFFKLTKTAKEQETALKELHTFTNKIIADRKEFVKNFDVSKYIDSDEYDNSKGKLTMLDLLLENEKTGNIDLESIREEVDTFMFEGHDTTAMALSYFIMAIANEPAIQRKIYEEMEQIFSDSKRLATMADLHEMRYLECCIKESLRLYPSVPFIARNLTQETVLSGYTVPANTFVHLFIYDLHRRPDLFPDPERFIPERFLPQNCLNRHPYAYIPFSAGSRNCIGQKFAMLEMKTVLSSLIRQFHIEPVTKPSELRFRTDLVLRTTHPIYVKFKNRE